MLLGSTALTCWWLWPLPTGLATRTFSGGDYPGVRADFYLIVWALAWDSHALLTQPWRLFHANSFYPSTLSLAYSEHFLGNLPLFAPAYWATGNPILAFNVLLLATYPLCAVAMYALARRWTTPAGAATASLFFAFTPWRYTAPPYVYLLSVHYLPLAILLTERWLDGAGRRVPWSLAVVAALQMLCSVYLAAAFLVGYGAYLPVALWHRRRTLDRVRVLGLAVALGAAGAVFALTCIPYLELARQGLLPSYGDDLRPSGATLGLVPYIAAGVLRTYLTREAVGPIGYALVAVALLPPWRGRRWALLVGTMAALLGVLFAFGPTIDLGGHLLRSPYRLLAAWLPGFATLRLPIRFVVLTQLGLAQLAGLGMGRLAGARPRAGPVAALAVALAAVTWAARGPLPLNAEPTGDAVPAAYRWLAAHGDGHPLLELPRVSFTETARRMYLSTFHWLPIIEGYSGYAPPTADHLHSLARGLPDPQVLQSLVDGVDVGWILVHRDELPEQERPAWSGPLPPGLEPAGSWQGDLVLRVSRAGSRGSSGGATVSGGR